MSSILLKPPAGNLPPLPPAVQQAITPPPYLKNVLPGSTGVDTLLSKKRLPKNPT